MGESGELIRGVIVTRAENSRKNKISEGNEVRGAQDGGKVSQK